MNKNGQALDGILTAMLSTSVVGRQCLCRRLVSMISEKILL